MHLENVRYIYGDRIIYYYTVIISVVRVGI
jgi:hypothetical protein